MVLVSVGAATHQHDSDPLQTVIIESLPVGILIAFDQIGHLDPGERTDG